MMNGWYDGLVMVMGLMKRKIKQNIKHAKALAAFATALVYVAFSHPALAIEIHTFKETPPSSILIETSAFLANQNKEISGFRFAQIDLNNDQVDEYLLRSKECDDAGFCGYYVLAAMNGKMLPLLMIDAKDVKISDTKTNGVHDILAIRSKKNDYKYLRYIWSPADMIYMPAEQFIEGQ